MFAVYAAISVVEPFLLWAGGKMMDAIMRTTLDSMLADRQALIGTPDEVAEQLRHHVDVFGEFEPSMQINFGGIGDAEALRTLELFASRVMPRFA